jgi:hypothetical protein
MPRIHCHYLDCVFLDGKYCTAAAIELDPDLGCKTYQPIEEIDIEDWDEEEEEDIDDWDEMEEDEDEDLWLDDDEDLMDLELDDEDDF